MKILLLTLLISTSVSALTIVTNPGPDGVRFNKIEIYRVEKSLKDKLLNSDKDLLTPEQVVELQNLQTILTTGKRAITWFEKINSARPLGNKLDLNAHGASKGMPMTAPMKTNTQILIDRYNKILNESSPLITNVITSSTDFPVTAPVSDDEFVKSIRAIDVVYQHTIRWSGAKDSLSWYINRSLWDVRGYSFLKETPDLEAKLNNWDSLTIVEKTNFSSWFLGLCHNGDFEDSDCQQELSNALLKNRAYSFYQRFNKYGESQYNSFFKIPTTRPEIFWNEEKTKLSSPFLTPTRTDVKQWLSDNIEDEWKGISFNLLLDFKANSNDKIPHIEFKSGVTAHVNDIAGDTITMDGDYSISSYDQRWTIRHEYGHILGFVDCYLEFYDVNEKAMIYYEIDIDNLMCSRHGHLNTEHITQLKSVYK
jgi:hypothetical protein